MKHHKKVFSVLLLSFMSFVVFAGCGSDDPDPLNIIGTWLMTAVGFEAITPITITITAHTSPTNITATATPGAGDPTYITGITVTTTAAAGSTKPRDITIMLTFNDGSAATFTGTVNDNNTVMSGTYTAGGSDSWSATKQ